MFTAKGLDKRVEEGLRERFRNQCGAVGTYLAMGRAADREGCPEVAEALCRFAQEGAQHAARCAELLGETLTDSTKENLKSLVLSRQEESRGTAELAVLAKSLGYEAIYETLQEIVRDEARHGQALEGMAKRYFPK